MKTLLRIARWVLLALVVLVVALSGGGYLWLRGALPQTSGTVYVQGISAAVEIARDSGAIPHIRGQTEADALFGLGYAHAQDRLWQMEFQRRIGNGRLSEILGDATLDTDKFLRTLGVGRAAAHAWQTLRPDSRRLVEAYVAGVNAFIQTHHGRTLPIEFTLLGFEPEPWRPEDVLVWIKMMAFNLSSNSNEELLRVKLTEKLGVERAEQLMPAYISDGPIILPQGLPNAGAEPPRTSAAASFSLPPDTAIDQLLMIQHTIQERLGMQDIAVGSNNWVIGGDRTTSGKPLLANDPHLGAQIPSIWYLAHISGGKLDAIGATLPGVPGIVLGHNQRIAWGVTNTAPDVQDYFVERIDAQEQVEYKGTREPLRIVSETIKVKGQADVSLRVRMTRHGPLLSDVISDTGVQLALRWTALDPEDHTLEAFFGINRAKTWAEFTAALADYKAPMQNFVYADIDGNIGYYAPGALPIRAGGDGTAPVPGWTGDYDWTGYVHFDQLPHVYNPPEGYIASANNKAMPDSYPYFITSKWEAPYRAMRIIELIESKPKLSPDDMAAMQADVVSVQARQLLPYLMRAETSDSRAQAALGLLRDWDASLKGESAQAAVFSAWYSQIMPAIFADELGEQLWKEYANQRDYIAMQLPTLLRQEDSSWCDDVTTTQRETCPQILGKALVVGLESMVIAQETGDINQWRWDKVHRVVFPHMPLDNVEPLKAIFSRSVPNGGDNYTLNLGAYNTPFEQRAVPAYRQIIDLSDLEASRFMHTVGQSGYVLSSDYSNLVTRWQRVEYLPMRYRQDAVAADARGRLVLAPKPAE